MEFLILCINMILLFAVVIIAVNLWRGKVRYSDTYSYREALSFALVLLLIATLISLFIYLRSDSFEGAITIFVICVVIILAATLQQLLIEYHIKRSGAKKRDRGSTIKERVK